MTDENNLNIDNEEMRSKYDSGLAQIYRLDKLWQEYQALRSIGGLRPLLFANGKLDLIFEELSADMDPSEWKTFKVFMALFIKHRKPIGKTNKTGLLGQTIMRKAIWLRQIEKAQGKGASYVSSSDDEVEE